MTNDLRLRRIFSEHTVKILSAPCEHAEMLRRREVFSNADSAEAREKISACVSALREYRRTLELWHTASHKLEQYFTFARLVTAYDAVRGALSDIADLGSICAELSEGLAPTPHFPKSENMRHFLLSFSDKVWITPDGEFSDEVDELADCVKDLGFYIPAKKALDIKPSASLSDAVCRLNAEDCTVMDTALEACRGFDFEKPLEALTMSEFFDEILRFIEKAKSCGVPHCLPSISEKRQYTAREIFDVTLLAHGDIVPNDVYFTEAEPFFFLTGANGGGKTTYLRAVGLNLVLFLAGCPIFARSAVIYPFGEVLTHFPADERFDDTGRLDEELCRAERMLAHTDAFLLFNETFSGADEARGFSLLMQTAEAIRASGRFGLYVTHFHKVADSDFPRLTTELDITDANRRTFRIVRCDKAGFSHAADILKKYRLDRESLEERRKKL